MAVRHHEAGQPFHYRHGWIRVDGPAPSAPRSADKLAARALGTPMRKAERTSPKQWAGDADELGKIDDDVTRTTSDNRLAAMWGKQGFSGKPDVVSPDDFDALPDGYTKIYRGLNGDNAHDYAEQFRSGDKPFAGIGVYGNGTYATDFKEMADSYASRGGSGELMRIALRPDAKVGTEDEVNAAWEGQVKAGNVPDALQGIVKHDVGKMATVLGYDAVKHQVKMREPYGSRWDYVIQNRTALVVAADQKVGH